MSDAARPVRTLRAAPAALARLCLPPDADPALAVPREPDGTKVRKMLVRALSCATEEHARGSVPSWPTW